MSFTIKPTPAKTYLDALEEIITFLFPKTYKWHSRLRLTVQLALSHFWHSLRSSDRYLPLPRRLNIARFKRHERTKAEANSWNWVKIAKTSTMVRRVRLRLQESYQDHSLQVYLLPFLNNYLSVESRLLYRRQKQLRSSFEFSTIFVSSFSWTKNVWALELYVVVLHK